jgi:hypothetical protein
MTKHCQSSVANSRRAVNLALYRRSADYYPLRRTDLANLDGSYSETLLR